MENTELKQTESKTTIKVFLSFFIPLAITILILSLISNGYGSHYGLPDMLNNLKQQYMDAKHFNYIWARRFFTLSFAIGALIMAFGNVDDDIKLRRIAYLCFFISAIGMGFTINLFLS